MSSFTFSGYAQDVVFGLGTAGRLDDALGGYGWSRLILITSGSHVRSGSAGRIESALGERLVASYDQVQPHVQVEQVTEALELASSKEVDAIIGLGGGSVIGMAKAISDRLHEARTGTLAREDDPLSTPLVPTIIIPTTYAGSEMTPVYGTTGPVDGVRRKMTVTGRNIVPRVVIYDPELTVSMPPDLTGTSAMNALAHCFEAIYSIKRDPVSTANALRGIRAIGTSLPVAYREPSNLDARSQLLEGAFLAGMALAQVQMGIHHGVCHVLGGSAGVPHGVANTIVLPHALRFNAEVARRELAEAAITLDLAGRVDDVDLAASRVIEWLDELGDGLELPKLLGKQGVNDTMVPELARIAMDGGPVKANPRPLASLEEMEGFLRQML